MSFRGKQLFQKYKKRESVWNKMLKNIPLLVFVVKPEGV